MKRAVGKKKTGKLVKIPGHKKLLQFFTVIILTIILTSFVTNKWQKYTSEQTDHLQPLKILNLEYCNGEKLDVVVPQVADSKALVIYVHGGGWRYGSKVGGMAPYLYQLTKRGIAVASINYRLTDRIKFPAQLEDVQCAVRFLKQNSQEFGYDTSKIILAGQSSGGNLALLAALSANNDVANAMAANNQYIDQSNIVAGVIAFDAHYDFNSDSFSKESKENIAYYLDGADATQASPASYLDQDDPSILIFHGLNDKTVSPTQADNFARSARELRLNVRYVPVENADHNLRSWFGRDNPDAASRLNIITDFIKNIK